MRVSSNTKDKLPEEVKILPEIAKLALPPVGFNEVGHSPREDEGSGDSFPPHKLERSLTMIRIFRSGTNPGIRIKIGGFYARYFARSRHIRAGISISTQFWLMVFRRNYISICDTSLRRGEVWS